MMKASFPDSLLRLFHSPEFECQGNTSIGEGTLRTPLNLEVPKECEALKHAARLAKNLITMHSMHMYRLTGDIILEDIYTFKTMWLCCLNVRSRSS